MPPIPLPLQFFGHAPLLGGTPWVEGDGSGYGYPPSWGAPYPSVQYTFPQQQPQVVVNESAPAPTQPLPEWALPAAVVGVGALIAIAVIASKK